MKETKRPLIHAHQFILTRDTLYHVQGRIEDLKMYGELRTKGEPSPLL